LYLVTLQVIGNITYHKLIINIFGPCRCIYN